MTELGLLGDRRSDKDTGSYINTFLSKIGSFMLLCGNR